MGDCIPSPALGSPILQVVSSPIQEDTTKINEYIRKNAPSVELPSGFLRLENSSCGRTNPSMAWTMCYIQEIGKDSTEALITGVASEHKSSRTRDPPCHSRSELLFSSHPVLSCSPHVVSRCTRCPLVLSFPFPIATRGNVSRHPHVWQTQGWYCKTSHGWGQYWVSHSQISVCSNQGLLVFPASLTPRFHLLWLLLNQYIYWGNCKLIWSSAI